MTFANLGLSKKGIHLQGRLLRWEDMETITSEQAVNIRQKDAHAWSGWNRRQFLMLNLPVFLKLANHYLKLARG